MNVSRIIAGMVVCVLSSQLAWSQEAKQASSHEVTGYFDYSTGVFRPISQMATFDSNSAAAANPTTGTIVVNLTVTIKSTVPSTSSVNCNVEVDVLDLSSETANLIQESATVVATRTGNTAKCTVTIPYSWIVLNPATSTVGINYNVTLANKTTPTTGLLSRSSSGSIANIPVPANGSTTTQTVNAVL